MCLELCLRSKKAWPPDPGDAMISWGAKISMQTQEITKVLIFWSLQCTLRLLYKIAMLKKNSN